MPGFYFTFGPQLFLAAQTSQLLLHQRHMEKLPSGLVDSGMRAGSTRQSPLLRAPGRRGGFGCSWVLTEHRTAAASLGKIFTAHSPSSCQQSPTEMGLVEEGTERVNVQWDLLRAGHTEMSRLTQHAVPKCLAKH